MPNFPAAMLRVSVMSAAVLLAAGGAARAENWIVRTEGSVRYEMDDNPLMSTDEAETISGIIATPKLSLVHDTGSRLLEFGGQVEANQYDDSAFNSNDVYLDFHGRKELEASIFDLRADFDYDTARSSEILDNEVLIAGVRHTSYSVRPHFEHRFTPTETFLLDASFRSSRYDSERYTDYQTTSIKPSLSHALSEIHSLVFAVEGQRYETKTGSVTSDNIIPSIGWTGRLSPRWQASLAGGVQYTETDYEQESTFQRDGSEWDYYYNGSITYLGLNDRISVDFTRRPTSMSSGSQSQATTLRMNATHTVSPVLDLKLGLIYQNSERSGSISGGSSDITFIEAAPQLVYRLTEKLNLNLLYRHREREFGAAEASSDAVMVTLTFKPDEFSID